MPLKRKKWFVWAKPPFSGPEAVLAYLARYTHRVAIANSRLIALDERGVTFRYKLPQKISRSFAHLVQVTSRRARSGRSSVTVKKKLKAATALLMLGGRTPVCA